MALTKSEKERIKQGFALNPEDTGSTELQIALLTERITQITAHLGQFKQDNAVLKTTYQIGLLGSRVVARVTNNRYGFFAKSAQLAPSSNQDPTPCSSSSPYLSLDKK